MDAARCLCVTVFESDTTDSRRVNPLCPIHGNSGKVPIRPWALTWTDKTWLRSIRIDPEDGEAIQRVRESEERRFGRGQD